jgi:hypothetical protein
MSNVIGDINGAGALALGACSLAIGTTELLAPHLVESLLGLPPSRQQQGIIRTLGVRELVHGVGILNENANHYGAPVGVRARVAGDALDTALLAVAMTRTRRIPQFIGVAALVGVIGLLDCWYAARRNLDPDRASPAENGTQCSRRLRRQCHYLAPQLERRLLRS